MLQQVMTNPGEITFREVPVPEVKDDQVLVKIRNIGICGSDIHVYHGKHPFTKYPPVGGTAPSRAKYPEYKSLICAMGVFRSQTPRAL